jgi:uncharacterized protein (TIGR00255 family)
MTGFGLGSAELPGGRVTVELRSLNHRYADLRLRLPPDLAPSESAIRRKVLERVRRGRVEVAVSVESESDEPRPRLNRPLLEEAIEACETLRRDYDVDPGPLGAGLLAIPGMFRSGPPPEGWDERRERALDAALDAALEALDEERRREGRHLGAELLARITTMGDLVRGVAARAAALPQALRDRLLERLRGLAPDVQLDPARVAQEAAIQADRCDVTEEVVRLAGHLAQVRELLVRPDGEPVGKRIDFLVQEIHRETNTINSKSGDLEMSRAALALKAELEKVREQVQNLE